MHSQSSLCKVVQNQCLSHALVPALLVKRINGATKSTSCHFSVNSSKEQKMSLSKFANSTPKRNIGQAKCPECSKIIQGSRSLKRHIKTHQPKSPRPQFDCCQDCPFCNYQGCVQLEFTKKHIQKQHADKYTEDGRIKCKRSGWTLTEDGCFEEGFTGAE